MFEISGTKGNQTHKRREKITSSKGNNFAIVPHSARGGRLGARAALIVLNKIRVSRNPNEAALLMKANQIRAMWRALKKEEKKGGRWRLIPSRSLKYAYLVLITGNREVALLSRLLCFGFHSTHFITFLCEDPSVRYALKCWRSKKKKKRRSMWARVCVWECVSLNLVRESIR